jgi:hypothetical protein
MVVVITVTTVVGAVAASGYVSRGGFWAKRIDPRVYVEDGRGSRATDSRGNHPQWNAVFTGEVYTTAERLRETAALAFVTSLRAAGEAIRHKPVQSVADLLAGVEQGGLMPPGLSIAENKTTVVSATGAFHVRYRPDPLAVEIISIPSYYRGGPALMVRVPEDDQPENGGGFRYFVAADLDGVSIPAPFARASELISAGWMTDTYKYKRLSAAGVR